MAKYVSSFKFNDTGDVINIKDTEGRNLISSLESNMNNKINNINSNINTNIKNNNYITEYLSGGKFLLFGDSYCVDENESLDPGWSDGQGFGKLMTNILNMTLYNYAVGGTGFGDYNTSINYLSQTNSAINAMSESDRNSVKLIIYAGGANDGDQSLSLLSSRIKSCYTQCRTYFPNAIIWTCFIGWSRNGATFEYFKRARNRWKFGCARSGMPCMVGSEWSLHHWDYVGTDNLHPSTTGQQSIKDFLLSGLFNKGVCNIELSEEKKQFTTLESGAGNFTGKGFKCSMIGNTCTFTNSHTTFGFSSTKSINFNGDDLYQVASIHSYMNGGIISNFGTGQQGTYNPTFYAMTLWYVTGQSFNQVMCMSKFTILDGGLWVSPFYTDGGMLKTFNTNGFEMFPATVTCSLDCC